MPRKKIYDSLPEFKICVGCGAKYSIRDTRRPSRYAKQRYCTAGCHIWRVDRNNYKRPLLSVPKNPRKAIRVIGPSIAYLVLTRGKLSLIDADVADDAEIYNWLASYSTSGDRFYALRKQLKISGNFQKEMHLHRQIMDAPDDMEVDHINGNGLDNRRANLRIATRAQNSWNTGVWSTNTSGYKGVHRRDNSWIATIMVHGRKYALGSFKEIAEAHQAYKDAEKRLRKW